MEKKWTPGPWEITGAWREDAKFEISIAENLFWIARVGAPHEDMPIATANAHLIAAAPEMYDALFQARKSLSVDCLIRRDENGVPFESTVGALKRVEAVLAKARGEGV